jgi:hypothetical protein
MNHLKVRRLTGAFGLAIVALNWAMSISMIFVKREATAETLRERELKEAG